MTTFLPKEVQAGLDRARIAAVKSASRLRVSAGGQMYPVLRLWKTGFSVEAHGAPHLRGFVDLYDGGVHLSHCLIVASEEDAFEMKFEFKRLTAVSHAPAIDFERAEGAPVALIESHQ